MSRGSSAIFLRTGFACLTAVVVACTPRHAIQVSSEAVSIQIEPGDTVVLTTTAGQTMEFDVAAVEEDALVADTGERVYLVDVAELHKKSWAAPRPVCGGDLPLGCSIPQSIAAIPLSKEYSGKFHNACVQHDFCYRHGYRTYGTDRETCDLEFYELMQAECKSGFKVLGLLESLGKDAVDVVREPGECLVIARQMYNGVEKYGEPHFRYGDGDYCEYAGPLEAPAVDDAALDLETTQ